MTAQGAAPECPSSHSYQEFLCSARTGDPTDHGSLDNLQE